MDIKNIEFTEQEFKILVDGLDALPEKGAAGEIFESLFTGIVGRDNPEALEEFKRNKAIEKRKADIAKEALKEDIRILQGKLLQFKRYLLQQGALKQTQDILEH